MQTPSISRGDLIALIGTTTRIFDECRLPNGALVEAPTHIPSYPADARPAFTCVPGNDLPLAILAMDALGRDVRPLLLPWLLERAQGLAECGLLARRYHPHGLRADDEVDALGASALALALQSGPSSRLSTQLISLLDLGLAGTGALIDDPAAPFAAPRTRALRRVAYRLQHDGHAERIDVAGSFLDAAASAARGDLEQAITSFVATMETADRDGHFPEWIGPGSAPRPLLRSHLAFLIAADALGEIASLPKSGYTARKR